MTSTICQSARLATAMVVFGVALGLASPKSVSALSLERCVSQDNHLYVILSSTSDFTQVTSVSMTNANANACCELGSDGDVLTALAAGSGVPLPNRARTTVIAGLPSNSVTCAGNFSASAAGGQGQLTLPGGVKKVSATEGFSTETVVPVTTADGAYRRRSTRGRSPGRSPVAASAERPWHSPPPACTTHRMSDTLEEQASQTAPTRQRDGSTIGNRRPGQQRAADAVDAGAVPSARRLHQSGHLPGHRVHRHQDGAIGSGVCRGRIHRSIRARSSGHPSARPAGDLQHIDPHGHGDEATRRRPPPQRPPRPPPPSRTTPATATATATGSTTATKTGTTTGTVTSTPTITPTPTATRTGICSLTPVAGCATPVGFHRPFRINHKKQLVTWRFRSTGSIPLADFDDPVNTTSYSLACMPARLDLPVRAACPGGRQLRRQAGCARGVKGFRYRDHTRSNSGISASFSEPSRMSLPTWC
jgi:hypothetical protein